MTTEKLVKILKNYPGLDVKVQIGDESEGVDFYDVSDVELVYEQDNPKKRWINLVIAPEWGFEFGRERLN